MTHQPNIPIDVDVEVVEVEAAPIDIDMVEAKPSLRTRARTAIRQTTSSVKQTASRGRRAAANGAQQNPFGLALGSLGLGLVAGLLLPTSRVEQEKLGPIADKVQGAGQRVKQDVADVKQGAIADAKQQS